ncbi:MAG TPA: hypothetical protein VFW87_11470 [Pirellulales bacterium]|nr:hypothetical protein [Pirellulales bacterium]
MSGWTSKARSPALALVAVFLSLIFLSPTAAAEPNSTKLNLVEQENRQPGSTDWQLTRVRADGGGFRSPWIEGYCSRQSVAAGESIDIMVSTDPPKSFQIEVFRMGLLKRAIAGRAPMD